MKTATEIAARAVCMGIVEFRARFEGARFGSGGGATPETTEMIAGVTGWLFDAGLSPSLLEMERALLSLPPNGWDREVLEALGDALLSESIGVLLGGLNLVRDLPAFDCRYDAEPLLRLLPFLSDSPFVTRPGMAPRDEWAAMAAAVATAPEATIRDGEAVAGLWWWRAVSESLVRGDRLPRARLDGILRDGEAHSRKLAIPCAGGDFMAFAKPYAKLSADEHRAVSAIAEARVRAFRFMLHTDPWDQISMDS